MLDRLAENFAPGQTPVDIFGIPQHFTLPDKTSTSTNLIWQPNNSASGFNIYRADSAGGPFTKLNVDPVPGASFADRALQPDTEYHYQVTAVEKVTGTESPPTDTLSISTAETPPSCDPYYSDNVRHVAEGRAYSPWLWDAFALGSNDAMGRYKVDRYSHLLKIGYLNYRVGYCM